MTEKEVSWVIQEWHDKDSSWHVIEGPMKGMEGLNRLEELQKSRPQARRDWVRLQVFMGAFGTPKT